MVKTVTCIECPMGCEILVELEGDKIASVSGNNCPRGKAYAENEVVCPRRIVTSTVRLSNGKLLPVKTDKPVKKAEMFCVMQKINCAICTAPIKIGDVLVESIAEGCNLVATGNAE